MYHEQKCLIYSHTILNKNQIGEKQGYLIKQSKVEVFYRIRLYFSALVIAYTQSKVKQFNFSCCKKNKTIVYCIIFFLYASLLTYYYPESPMIPRLIKYTSIQQFPGKVINVNEKEDLNLFNINRIYWIDFSATTTTNSTHAHKTLKQVLISIHGSISIELESQNGELYQFTLSKSTEGLYIPSMYWKKIEYNNPCTLLCLASEEYNEEDYIREYDQFKNYVIK
jgi:hypothetical protein